MPGGYGTKQTPWEGAGDTGYQAPAPAPSDGGPIPPGEIATPTAAAGNIPGTPLQQPTQLEIDIATGGTQQPTESFVDYEGAMSNEAREALRAEQGFEYPSMMDTGNYGDTYNVDNPYYPTGSIQTSQLLPEQKPLTQPSKFMLANVIADEIAKNPKYKDSFEGQQGITPNTLGKIIATNRYGDPIMDSSGNPIYTTFGKAIVDKIYESYDPKNPIDITQPGAFEEYFANYEELDKYERDFWRDQQDTSGGGRYSRGYGRGQRGSNLALLRALAAGSPTRKLEKSGFMASMVDPFAKATKIAGEKGIFSGLFGKAGQVGVSGEGMKRLLKSWGSGYTNPLYANVAARGGIMSAWNNMRR